ncbi:MAG: hypothetical protein KTV72_02660 [Wolbachia endosymbiont of Melophagus ovinus]|nr:hypothetical protein [Wolbachia endosymbiont of Melophagus ovinus]
MSIKVMLKCTILWKLDPSVSYLDDKKRRHWNDTIVDWQNGIFNLPYGISLGYAESPMRFFNIMPQFIVLPYIEIG